MLFSQEVKSIREAKTVNQLAEAEEKIRDINSKIIALSKQQEPQKSQTTDKKEWDWAQSYTKFSEFEDIDDLKERKKTEEQKMSALTNNFDNLGHYHDHSKEREIFEKPEDEKLKLCEDYRFMGNYCFSEGMFSQAAEKYQIAIAYYEYCFPDSDEKQQQLNDLRHACLCNIALCSIYLGLYRQAIHSADMVIRETKGTHAKAFFRRGQAFRYLSEFDNAMVDLRQALALAPNDSKIIEEMRLVKSMNAAYHRNQAEFAKLGLNVKNIYTEERGEDENNDISSNSNTSETSWNNSSGIGSGVEYNAYSEGRNEHELEHEHEVLFSNCEKTSSVACHSSSSGCGSNSFNSKTTPIATTPKSAAESEEEEQAEHNPEQKTKQQDSPPPFTEEQIKRFETYFYNQPLEPVQGPLMQAWFKMVPPNINLST